MPRDTGRYPLRFLCRDTRIAQGVFKDLSAFVRWIMGGSSGSEGSDQDRQRKKQEILKKGKSIHKKSVEVLHFFLTGITGSGKCA